MIDYEHFAFATPPRTGSAWLTHAVTLVGLPAYGRSQVHFPQPTEDRIRVTTVRHPVDWLRSYFLNVYPGKIGMPQVDAFAELRPSDTEHYAKDQFDGFVQCYLDKLPGAVGRMFYAYEPTQCLKLEQIEESFISLCRAAGLGSEEDFNLIRSVGRRNSTKGFRHRGKHQWHDLVMQVETEYCEQFDYH